MAGAPPEDTIAAVATAAGRGGIGILRLSGPAALAIARRLTGRDQFRPRYAHRADFHDAEGTRLDDGLALYFPGPHSFTGEDVIELNCHGSPVVLDLLLQAAQLHERHLPYRFFLRSFFPPVAEQGAAHRRARAVASSVSEEDVIRELDLDHLMTQKLLLQVFQIPAFFLQLFNLHKPVFIPLPDIKTQTRN